MNFLKKYDVLILISSLIIFIGGLLFVVFSYQTNFMRLFLGYFVGAILMISSLIYMIYRLIKDDIYFFRIVYSILLFGAGFALCFYPYFIVSLIPLFLGITISLVAIIFIIKFLILKKVSLKSMYNIVQLVLALILLAAGILFIVFYKKIDVYLTSIIIGIPLMVVGIAGILISLIRIIRNR